MTPILFFSDDIAINPHSASQEFRAYVEKAQPITVAEFASQTGNRVSLYQLDNGDLLLEAKAPHSTQTPIFIEGSEAA